MFFFRMRVRGQIVSDKGPQFSSDTPKKIVSGNGIRHVTGLLNLIKSRGRLTRSSFNPPTVPWTSFDHSQRVWVRNYRSGRKYLRGMVIERKGPVLYGVKRMARFGGATWSSCGMAILVRPPKSQV